jgi:hypothetical protein
MKTDKKKTTFIPDVHILGDLKDVRKLIKLANKKKNLVIYRNGETGTQYANSGKKMLECSDKDIAKLSKDHRLIYFDFFPGSKEMEAEKKAAVKEKKPRQKRVKTEPKSAKKPAVKTPLAEKKETIEKVATKRKPRVKKAAPEKKGLLETALEDMIQAEPPKE